MGRPAWLGAGVALGVGGTLWVEKQVRRRLRRAARRLGGDGLVGGARASVGQLGWRLRDALESGRAERDRRAAELFGELGMPAGADARREAGALASPGALRPAVAHTDRPGRRRGRPLPSGSAGRRRR
ncbi:MAG TPA: hypothetical protein VKV36_11845 [Acidimicrobiales bacterium]|nr:hypothetical protein [Acidimicrobiales bacterium]